MSFETIVFGYIEGAKGLAGEHYRSLQRLNEGVIEVLPEYQDFPVISRAMFASTGLDPECGTFRSQVIHFGASYKNMEAYNGFDDWLARFERYLCALFWVRARVQFVCDISGEHLFDYEIIDSERYRLYEEKPLPTTKWTRRYFELMPSRREDSNWLEK